MSDGGVGDAVGRIVSRLEDLGVVNGVGGTLENPVLNEVTEVHVARRSHEARERKRPRGSRGLGFVDVSDRNKSEGWESRVLVFRASVTTLRVVITSRVWPAGAGFVTHACLAVPTYVSRFVAIPTMLTGLLCHIVSARGVTRVVGVEGCKR